MSGDELDHGDADPSFGSLRVSFKVLAQPASKEFAQVTPQTVVNGLPRAAAMPGSSRKRSKMPERRAATDVIGKPRADSSQSALNEPATREDRKAARTVCQRVTRAGRSGGDQRNI